MPTWLDTLQAGRVVIRDGGTGSELRRRGVPLDDHTWSALAGFEHPQLLAQIHMDYIAAGADVITTNTFGTSRFVLEAAGIGNRFAAINRAAIAAAKEARRQSRPDVAIAASMSCLPPRSDPEGYPGPAAERAAYAELAELFAAEGVDLIALEMLQDDRHARLACEAVRAVGLPFWLGVSCRLGPSGEELVAFDYPHMPFGRVLDALLPYGPAAVAVMHTPTNAVSRALAEVRSRWPSFVGTYPEIDSERECTVPRAEPLAPQDFTALATMWIDAGASLLGGCCGTTPEHIRALRLMLSEQERNQDL
jgi:S-methylmethionine-dependent homocysteine/selenocysteine methylase